MLWTWTIESSTSNIDTIVFTDVPQNFIFDCNDDSIFVSLEISDLNGQCSDSFDTLVNVNCLPIIDNISHIPNCQVDSIILVASALPTEAETITQWLWGNQYSITPNTQTSFILTNDTCGILQNQSLVVRDNHGCLSQTAFIDVDIYCLPNVEITAESVCEGDESLFELNFTPGSSMNIPSLSDEFSWTFDGIYDINNGSLTSPNISLVYNTCGNYEASLLLTDNNGCLAYDTIPYTVACNSFAEILTNDTSGCAPFEFTIEALDEQNTGQYFWTWTPVDDNVQISYTNGSTADPTALVQLFTNNGPSDLIYTIVLETDIDEDLSNQLGGLECRSQDSIEVILHPIPIASADLSDTVGCGPLTVEFTNTSIGHNNEGLEDMSFNWIIVGYDTITDQIDLTWEFDSPQSGDTTYTVILEAYTQNDCFADTSFEVTVYPNPIAEIELDDNSDTLNCAPFTISSQHIEAVEYPENNTTYQWTFYNAFDNSVVQNGSGPQPPSFTMDNPGDSIIIELIVTNDFECVADTAYMSFYTWKQPDVSFSVDDVCLGDTSFFIDETSPGDSPLQDWLWTINGSGLFLDETDSSSEDPIYKFENCTENLALQCNLGGY